MAEALLADVKARKEFQAALEQSLRRIKAAVGCQPPAASPYAA